jgi:indole-3-glycerol phosphate synthase
MTRASILDEILEHKRAEVEAAKSRVSPDEMSARATAVGIGDGTRQFRAALVGAEPPAVIAELKRRSPSRGEIRADFDPAASAKDYAEGGAAALSVLTDERYFGGHLDYLRRVRAEVALPLLRKDFTIDTYQIDEARAAGADAVLLIVSALSDEQLSAFRERARSRFLDCLVEVHDEAELERALSAGADLIGVNNRNLATFEVDLATTERLARCLPADRDVLLVAESGIHPREDIQRLSRAGAGAFLVGESLMRQPDVARALRELRRDGAQDAGSVVTSQEQGRNS